MIWAVIQGAGVEYEPLTTAGLAFMLGVWTLVLGTVVWCFRKVLAKNVLSTDEDE
jgi:hypothetical protein